MWRVISSQKPSSKKELEGEARSTSGGSERGLTHPRQVEALSARVYPQLIPEYLQQPEDHTECFNTAWIRLNLEEAYAVPLPWLEHQDFLSPGHRFVNLQMQILNTLGLFTKGPIGELSQILAELPIEEGNGPKPLLVRGEAGYGKSFGSLKVAYDWGKNVQTFPAMPVESNLMQFRARLQS